MASTAWGVPQGATIAPFGFTGELQGGAGLTYLRARWYNAASGCFGSRDPFAGFAEQPYSLHSYQYGYSNPVLYTDPSGQSPDCQSRGICGPEATTWFFREIEQHIAYGQKVKQNYETMKDRMWSACDMSELVAGLEPFEQMVSELGIGSLSPEIGGIVGNNSDRARSRVGVVRALGLLEFALYGLAVNYGNSGPSLNYDGNRQCATCKLTTTHPTITLCGKCVDTTDLGNIMFGVGGRARGWSQLETTAAASLFNLMTDESPFNQDPRGAIIGWALATPWQAIRSEGMMCGTLWVNGFLGYNEAPDETKQCVLCTRDTMTDNGVAPSSLYLRSEGDPPLGKPSSTMQELGTKAWDFIQRRMQ